ncbi:MAG: succinate dehydrogenase assembly factor 2 [Sulfuricella sp.]|nr:succinate dehydrogenase assembly factor 2 [Sulfuricella sp.]
MMEDGTQVGNGDGFSHHPSPIPHHQTPFGRLRWHSRRGMLELDILLARFWARFGAEITDTDAVELEKLLEWEDNDLLLLILNESSTAEPGNNRVLAMLRMA